METNILPLPKTHVNHDQKWLLPGSAPQFSFCLACLMELLEDDEIALCKKHFMLMEILNACKKPGFLLLLNENGNVAAHVVSTLSNFVFNKPSNVSNTAIEGIVILAAKLANPEIIFNFLKSFTHKVLQECQYKQQLAALQLIFRLLQNHANLSLYILQQLGGVVNYLVGGLSCGDESVQSVIVTILIRLYDHPDMIIPRLHESIAQHILQFMTSSQLPDLLTNTLGLLGQFLTKPHLTVILMSTSVDKLTLPVAFKKLLISSTALTKQTLLQCMVQLLGMDEQHQYANQLLSADLAEFLYEAFATTNDVLIASIFHCLNMISGCKTYFTKCHCVYGMEPMLRGMEQAFQSRNKEAMIAGLILFSTILKEHKEGIRLFSNLNLVKQALSLLTKAIRFNHTSDITSLAVQTLANLLADHHLPGVIPLRDIMACIIELLQKSPDYLQPIELNAMKSQLPRLERYLSQVLLVLNSATSFMLGHPAPSEEASFAPVSSTSSSDAALTHIDFLHFLKDSVHDVAIPLYTRHWELVKSSEILLMFSSLMNLVFTFPYSLIENWSIKLASSDFIGFFLDLKKKHSSTVDCKQVDLSLELLCKDLLNRHHPPEDWSVIGQVIRDGLPHLSGSISNCVINLRQLNDESLQSIPLTTICLLFLSYYYQPESTPHLSVLVEVTRYLCTHHDISSLPKPFLIHITFAISLFSGELSKMQPSLERQYKGASDVLSTVLSKTSSLETWKCLHIKVVEWCFTHKFVQETIGQKVLCLWLAEKREIEPIKILLKQNNLILETLLNIISSAEDKEIVNRGTNLLLSVLHKDLPPTVQLRDLERHLSSLLLKQFLQTESCTLPDRNVMNVISILNKVKLNQDMNRLPEPSDLKLLYYIVNVMNKDDLVISDELVSCVHLLAILLVQAILVKDDQVSCLLVGQSVAVKRITEWSMTGSRRLRAVSSLIISCMIEQNIPYKFTTKYVLPFETLMSFLRSDDRTMKLSFLHMTGLLLSTELCPIITLQSADTKRSLCDQYIKLNSTNIRQLYIVLQQAFFQDDEMFSLLALQCMTSLLQYLAEKAPKLEKHVRLLSWNKFLFTHCATENPSVSRILLLALLFDDHHQLLTSKFTNNLYHTLLESDGQCRNQKDGYLTAARAVLVEKMLSSPACLLFSESVADSLRCQVNKLQPLKSELLLSSKNSVLCRLLQFVIDING